MNIRYLGLCDYIPVWQAMRDYTETRGGSADDALWVVEHPPVYTQGLAGKAEHILNPGNIPIVPIDRGGQVTYHGPGQLVIYLLWDIKSAGIGIRALVSLIENSIIALLNGYGIAAVARADAPGVYVEGCKIASLGLKVRRGCTYHGLSLNVDMDLTPFSGINPCGLQGMRMTQLRDFGVTDGVAEAGEKLCAILQAAWDTVQKSKI